MSSADVILTEAVTNPASPVSAVRSEVVEQIEAHRLAPLAWDAITRAGSAAAWPAAIQDVLRRVSAVRALASELMDAELQRVVTALGAAGVRVVVMKGAALAHTHYRSPHLRPRLDSDILIDEAHRDETARVLAELGYTRSHGVDGALVTQQLQWTRPIRSGLRHALDVHWRVFNPHLFGGLLPVERLMSRAVPVPALGSHAYAPCSVDALVLACAHKVAHHAGDDDPLWDYDIHLLLSSLNERETVEFIDAVASAELEAVSAAGIASAHSRFNTALRPAVRSMVERAAGSREPTAGFLESRGRQVDVLVSDLRAVGGWRARLSLLSQHLFPPQHYMLEKYGHANRVWLPWLYLRRLWSGAPRWLRARRS